jgi:predicted Zn-dependent protease
MAKKTSSKKSGPPRKSSSTVKREKSLKTSTRTTVQKKKAPAESANRAAKARRQKSREAVALYEKALKTLQRRNLLTASDLFQKLIDDFPEERELHERSRRYLAVCRRGSNPAPNPKTFEERVYAATLALNAGSSDEALQYLKAALVEQPDNDHVQYMLAVTRAVGGERSAAVTHLGRAIELNPDNRFLARNEPSFAALRDEDTFWQVVCSSSRPD